MIIMIITVKMKMMRIVLFQKENQKILEGNKFCTMTLMEQNMNHLHQLKTNKDDIYETEKNKKKQIQKPKIKKKGVT